MADRINLPGGVHVILNALNTAGYEAFIVGGCVRDSFMGRVPKDWDITTSARPEKVKGLFAHTYDTGIQHGTVTVRIGQESYEVTTYRVDGAYTDHRRPDTVSFSTNLREDLLRRDFTINAMAYHPKSGIIDHYHGREDLRDHIIRCVGSPADRFREDALRMLRAVRFAAQLDFSLEPNTREAIRLLSPTIAHVSWERIRDELNKVIISDHPEMVEEICQLGLMHHILPEWEACLNTPQNTPYHKYTVGRHMIETMKHIEQDPVLRWTMFLHDIGKPAVRTTDPDGTDHFIGHIEKSVQIADQAMRRLKFDNASRNRILQLIRYHEIPSVSSEKDMRSMAAEAGPELMEDLFKVMEADARGKKEEVDRVNQEEISRMKSLYARILQDQDPLRVGDLKINGKDLKDLGYPSGPVIGRVLDLLFKQVLSDPSLNEHDLLIRTAASLKDAKELQNFSES